MKNAIIAMSLMAGAVAFAAPGVPPVPAPGPHGPGMHKPCQPGPGARPGVPGPQGPGARPGIPGPRH